MKKSIKHICTSIAILTVFCMPIFTHAQMIPSSVDSNIKIDNPVAGVNNLTDFINAILNNVVMPIAAVVAVVYIIWAGFLYVTAQGNSKKISEANQNLLWALIGTGVLLGAAGISKVITGTVNSFLH